MLCSPQVHVDGVEHSKERESPRYSIYNHALAVGEELVDYGAEEEYMDERPNEERPGGGGDVGLLAVIIDALGSGDSVNIGTEEYKIDEDVNNFQEDSVFPRVCHGCSEVGGGGWVGGNGATLYISAARPKASMTSPLSHDAGIGHPFLLSQNQIVGAPIILVHKIRSRSSCASWRGAATNALTHSITLLEVFMDHEAPQYADIA